MSRHHLPLTALLLGLVTSLVVLAPTTAHARPIEGYASYVPQSTCSPTAKPGTVLLGRWMVRHYGGGFGSISRRCSESTSEHQEGRAFDWRLDAGRAADRARAKRFLERVRRTDHVGNTDAWARRMGIMYVIWNDRMYAAWDGFRPEPYLSSSCRTKQGCSRTLRHRDHLHVSLTRRGGWGGTSWYAGRIRL